ncbi:hypothetical protein BG015_003842 [Linnemannia schmuckeri]|uniref:Uncharacterized protein n=1 Tax=Linnemannia schmuckeri TaxID=64567 RepID=A0A9P5RG32_9FUNG|nr:hypothetical protein BG015_003842 [Linnemannia schmuckeri]
MKENRSELPPRPHNLCGRTKTKEMPPLEIFKQAPLAKDIPKLSVEEKSVKSESTKGAPSIPAVLNKVTDIYPQVRNNDGRINSSKNPDNSPTIIGNNNSENHKNSINNNFYNHIHKDNDNMAEVLSRLELTFAIPSKPYGPKMFLTAGTNPKSLSPRVLAPERAVKRFSPSKSFLSLLTTNQRVFTKPACDSMDNRQPVVYSIAIKAFLAAIGCIEQLVASHPTMAYAPVV